MFEQVPASLDVYLLSCVVVDWDDEHSIAILKNCRRAMGPDGRLLLLEEVIPPGDTPSYGKLNDLNMLVSPGGQGRTEAGSARCTSSRVHADANRSDPNSHECDRGSPRITLAR